MTKSFKLREETLPEKFDQLKKILLNHSSELSRNGRVVYVLNEVSSRLLQTASFL